MKKEILSILLPFISLACQLNDHVVGIDLKVVPISGTVYDNFTGTPLRNCRVVLRKGVSEGLFGKPTEIYYGDMRTDENGYFEFKPTDPWNLELLISCDDSFYIEENKYPKYWERRLSTDEYNATNLNIALIPNGVLYFNFKTDNPLKEKEHLSIGLDGFGFSYSSVNQPPSVQKTMCRAGRTALRWSISRITPKGGLSTESFHDEKTIKAFMKGEYVINY